MGFHCGKDLLFLSLYVKGKQNFARRRSTMTLTQAELWLRNYFCWFTSEAIAAPNSSVEAVPPMSEVLTFP